MQALRQLIFEPLRSSRAMQKHLRACVRRLTVRFVRRATAACRASGRQLLGLYFHDHLNFDRNAKRQAANSNGGPCMFGAEDLLEEIRGPVDHARMFAEVRHCVDHSKQLDDASGLIKTAELPSK